MVFKKIKYYLGLKNHLRVTLAMFQLQLPQGNWSPCSASLLVANFFLMSLLTASIILEW